MPPRPSPARTEPTPTSGPRAHIARLSLVPPGAARALLIGLLCLAAAILCLELQSLLSAAYAIRIGSGHPSPPPGTALVAPLHLELTVAQRIGEAGDLLELLALAVFVAALARALAHPSGASLPRTSRRVARLAWSPLAPLLSCVVLAVAARFAGQDALAASLLAGGAALLLLLYLWTARPTAGADLWRRWLPTCVGLALGLRLLAAVALHLYGLTISPRGIVLSDESAQDYIAQVLVQAAHINEPYIGLMPATLAHLTGPLASLQTLAYLLVGPTPLTARFLGAFAGAAVALLGGAITRRLYGPRIALLATLLLAMAPGLVFWSVMVLREWSVALLVMLCLWAAASLTRRTAPLAVPCIAITLHVLWQVRWYVTIALLVALAVGLLALGSQILWRRGWRGRLGALAAGLLCAALVGLQAWPGGLDRLVRQVVYEQTVLGLTPAPIERLGPDTAGLTLVNPAVGGEIDIVRQPGQPDRPGMLIATRPPAPGSATGTFFIAFTDGGLQAVPASQVLPLTHINAADARAYALANASQGIVSALTSPLASARHDLPYLFLQVDAVTWLALLGLAIVGLALDRRPASLVLAAYVLVLLLTLGLANGNPGNTARERSSATLPALVVLAMPTLAALARRLRATAPRRLTCQQGSGASAQAPSGNPLALP